MPLADILVGDIITHWLSDTATLSNFIISKSLGMDVTSEYLTVWIGTHWLSDTATLTNFIMLQSLGMDVTSEYLIVSIGGDIITRWLSDAATLTNFIMLKSLGMDVTSEYLIVWIGRDILHWLCNAIVLINSIISSSTQQNCQNRSIFFGSILRSFWI